VKRLFSLCLLASTLFAQEGPPVQVTDSGLEYQVLQAGKEGTNPVPGDRVKVHYTGTFRKDGKKFDSSHDRGKPLDFLVGAGMVIDGWDEAVTLMTLGSKIRVTIPWKLAYGERGTGTIPPKADLVFEMHLVDVEKGDPLPVFEKPDADKQKTTASGLKYEVLSEGEGDPIQPGQGVKIRFMLWNPEGQVVACTEAQDFYIAGLADRLSLGRLRLEWLQEAPLLMKRGGRYRFEVPAELCFGDRAISPKLPGNTTSYWYLEPVAVNKAPAFVRPDLENAKKTESGLRYEVIAEGSGERPTRTDVVRVHYTGWLANGKVFDSSHARGDPAVFRLDQVIPGWTEGVGLMKEGATYRFTIPGDLAYGPRPPPGSEIPPNATLIFLVELIKIQRR
jgi:peptidylprolyl isomerase